MAPRREKYRDPQGPAWPTFVRLMKFAWKFRAQAVVVISLAIAGIALEVAQVKYLGTGINQIQQLGREIAAGRIGEGSFWQALIHPQSEFTRAIRWVSIVILALAALRGLSALVTQVAVTHFREKIVWNLRGSVFSALQRLSWGYYDKNFSGQIINRATGDVQTIRRFISNAWYNSVQTLFYIIGYVGLMLSISWQLTIASVATLPLMSILLVNLAKKLRPAFRAARDKEDELITALQENIAGVQVVKAFAKEQDEIAKFERISGELYDKTLHIVDLFRTYMPTIRGLIRLNQVAMLGLGALLVMNGKIHIGDLVVFTAAVGVIGGRIQIIMDLTNLIQEAIASAERVFEILDAKPEVTEKPNARPMPAGNGHVVFEGVWFGYQPDKPVLKDVYLEVKPGEVIGIAGPTGSGKTTLVNMIPRFYDPQQGKVIIDGIDLRDVRLHELRRCIGIVFQESFLFNDTIANNIAFGVPQASFEEIVEAAKLAQAHDFITEMEHGYDTIIGERGVTLSGGQRQRIALARALIKKPRILILDDAFASVDAETEHAIISGLDRILHGRTVFIISHRITILRRTQRIIVLQDGQIVQAGTHEDLLAQPGVYRQTALPQLQELSQEETEELWFEEAERAIDQFRSRQA